MENHRPDRPVPLLSQRRPALARRTTRFSVLSTSAGLFIFRILRHPNRSIVLQSGVSILLVLSLSSASISSPVQNATLQKARDAFVRAQEMERTLNDKSPEQRTR